MRQQQAAQPERQACCLLRLRVQAGHQLLKEERGLRSTQARHAAGHHCRFLHCIG